MSGAQRPRGVPRTHPPSRGIADTTWARQHGHIAANIATTGGVRGVVAAIARTERASAPRDPPRCLGQTLFHNWTNLHPQDRPPSAPPGRCEYFLCWSVNSTRGTGGASGKSRSGELGGAKYSYCAKVSEIAAHTDQSPPETCNPETHPAQAKNFGVDWFRYRGRA